MLDGRRLHEMGCDPRAFEHGEVLPSRQRTRRVALLHQHHRQPQPQIRGMQQAMRPKAGAHSVGVPIERDYRSATEGSDQILRTRDLAESMLTAQAVIRRPHVAELQNTVVTDEHTG